MHDHRRSNVTVESASAIAAVCALGQRLLGDGPAFWAHLGSSSRIDLHDLTTSVRSFVEDHCGQLRPRGVVHMLREHPASEALDIQVFNRNASEAVDDLAAFFVQKIAPGIGNVRLQFRNGGLSLSSRHRPALASGKGALNTAELARVPLYDVRAGDGLPVAESNKGRKPHVDADAIGAGALNRFDLDVKDNVPLSSVAREDSGLRLAGHVAMPTNLDLTGDADKSELAGLADRHSVANAEIGGVVAVTRSEPWKTWFLPAFTAREERLERLVQLAHNLLFSRR